MPIRFLISRLSSLGDVVCTLPVASALKAGHPGCEVVWAVDPRFAGIVECCTMVDQVVPVKPTFNPSSWPKIEGRFEAALDLQGLFKSAIPVARATAVEKVGYHWQREGSGLFSTSILPDPTSFHIVDQYIDVARAVGGEAEVASFALEPRSEDLNSVRAKLADGEMSEGFVVLNPGAGWVTKRWPPAHFSALVEGLADAGIQSVLIGGKSEPDQAAAREVKQCSNIAPAILTGETSVRELVALLSMARAHVGGDTGSTHIMAALGRPSIGLYSITRPQRSCPYGQLDRCHYESTGLANIPAAAVLATVLEAIR